MLSSRRRSEFAASLSHKLTMCCGEGVKGRHHTSAVAGPFVFVCLAISGLCGCASHQYRDWSGDAIVFGNFKVITTAGRDFTSFCTGGALASADYVPGKPYSYHGASRDHTVYISRFDSDGSYFSAAAPNAPMHLYLNCRQVLARSLTKETDYQLHIDIGTFSTPEQRAASYLGYLTVHLENDGKVTTGLNKDDDARLEKVPLPIGELHLPLVRIPLASIGRPTGWSSSTSSHMNVLFP